MEARQREEEREERRVRMQANKVLEHTLLPPPHTHADPCFTQTPKCSTILCTPVTWATALPAPILLSA